MDLQDSRHRSISQTSLHSSYQAHERQSDISRLRSPPQLRRPYQSLNETSALLRSPGPLESMLKTTTETGDIGIFSIKPPTPSVGHRHPRRPRPEVRVQKRPSRSHPKGFQDDPGRDDRKSLPSYRDTASEIISLYGSPAHPSLSRSLSPSSEDGYRSHSLTTCSSRRIPSFKSSGTFQSLPSTSGLQRPRSPYPYPTRLRRPGVRPASPAMSDNGVIDYSRMVGIDRVSQRTVYWSHKSRGPRSHHQYPPLSMRPEFSRSTSSLPSHPSPGPYQYGPGPSRSRTLNRMQYWGVRPQYRQTGSSDQSIRSASLTSIVEMYQGTPLNTNVPLPRAAGSFYYDYTEEFETEAPYEQEHAGPLCPIPQRVGGIRHPFLLRTDGTETTDDSDTPATIDSSGTNKDHFEAPSEKDTNSQSDADFDKAGQQAAQGHQSTHEDAVSPRRTSIGGRVTVDSQNVLAHARRVHSSSAPPADVQPSGPKNFRRSKTLDAEPNTLGHLYGAYMNYSSDSVLTERGSVAQLSEISQHDLLDDEDIDGDEAITACQGEEQFREGFPEMSAPPPPEARPSQLEEYAMTTQGRAGRGRHRRNPATTNIGVPKDSIPTFPNPGRERANVGTPILSPNPISPVKQLRVTNSIPQLMKANSIPQLMKALPPLPDEALKTESPHGTSPTETEISTGLLYSSPVNTAVSVEPEPNASTVALKSFFYDETLEPRSHQQLRASPSRFKVRLRSSQSAGFQREGDDSSTVPNRSSSNPIKPRLRLKVSRNKISQKPLAHDGTVIRNADLGHFNSLLELKHFPQKETLTNRSSFGEALEEELAHLGLGENRLSSIDESTKRGRHCSSDQFDITYPPSHRGIPVATPVPQPNPGSVISPTKDRAKGEDKKTSKSISCERQRPNASTAQCWSLQLFRRIWL
ncbi:hypothetical protein NCS52_00516900 [Fusarium sp. LHS14.1]|nr:hypothetical protein NCS52_00516900 [Fusarium sp. LHS14.1]